MMKGNINLISYDCYQQATEKQLAGLKWKENRVYYISEIRNERYRMRFMGISMIDVDVYHYQQP